MTIQQAFEIAVQHHQAGRLAQAEALYRQILAADPRHDDALNLLGVIANQTGHADVSVDLIGRAIALSPQKPLFHFNLAVALSGLGRRHEAIAAYRRAIALQPGYAEAHNNLANELKEAGEFEEAAAESRRAIELRPDFAEAWNNLGNVLGEIGPIEEAIACYRRALQLRPELAEIHNNLGDALRKAGRFDESIAACRRAIELNPALAEAHGNLGNAFKNLGRADEAAACYRRAIELKPGYAEAFSNLASLLEMSALDEAIACYERALALQPDSAATRNNLGNALKAAGRLDDALACYRRAMTLAPDNAALHSNLIYTMHFHPACGADAIAAEHARWDRRFAEPQRKFHRPHANSRDPGRRLRIGYVSPDFTRHVISHFLVPLLEGHDHAQFEIQCYASVKRPDRVTERIRQSTDVWKDVLGVPDDALAEMVRADGIDILVDLTQHMADNRLLAFARKPAPVQVAWVGYPGTVGLREIDYRLTDAWMEPEGASWAAESVETPVRLPDSWFCFDPIDEFPPPGELPASRTGRVTFGCLNAFCKVTAPVLERWAAVLRVVPESRLLLRCPEGATQRRVREFFSTRGIGADRIELVGWVASRAEFLRLFERIDLALDPFPYNGGTTTCEALWMGVPVLTCPAPRVVSRIGLSILSAAGMPEFVADSEEGEIALAASLAGDLSRLARLRATLRERMRASPFMDGPRFARNVERAYRAMWRAWCER